MKILVSPTKTMAFDKIPASLQMGMSRPRFEREAGLLNQELKALDFGTVKDMFKTSDRLTQKTRDHIHDFTLAVPGPALFTFQGEAFKTMNPRQFDPDQLAFANETLKIFSGLYGVLRPMDGIKPYRLDFNTPLPRGSKKLKLFWKEKIISYFEEQTQKGEVILNLASEEYSSILDSSRLKSQGITLQFREMVEGKLKNLSVRAKQARGLFAGEIIQKKMTNVNAIKKISLSGYGYREDLSTRTEWFFIRRNGEKGKI
jgi:cytoplasmic iron level regulating protein YaaA (DUF328/UPF0246 family)